MDSNDNFSAKKKKDLVAIAVHFGFLTESKAGSMSKQNLIDFLSEKERVSQPESPNPVEENTNEKSASVHSDPSADDVRSVPENEEPQENSPESPDHAKSSGKNRSRSSARRRNSAEKRASGAGKAGTSSSPSDPERNDADLEGGDGTSQSENGKANDTRRKKAASSAESRAPSKGKAKPSKSRKRSIIIQPKNGNDGYPDDGDYAPDGDFSEEQDEWTDTNDSSAGKGDGSVRTLRRKEPEAEMITGVLEIMPEGFGFIRRENYLPSSSDIFIHSNYVRRFGLRTGDQIKGPVRPKKDSDKYAPLQYVKEVNELPPEKMQRRPHFDRLTPIHPDERYVLETEKIELSTRIIDLIAPIGKGQRGMIVSPPKAGKTILLQKIANAISTNNPQAKLIVLLIDERPEEVTDMQRSIRGEVVYSTFDKKPENHTKIVELVLERAMRLVELEHDVVILLDSITRLSRAYNLTINPTGRTLSGGLDPGALYGPKRFFGAARNIENGGSLTIIATSLIDTGSRMDEVIFEEFKGTGNMEVYLDRKLSEKRIFPAIDINKSGTRREELLLGSTELDAVWTIRRAFGQLDTSAVTEMIINLLMKTQTNQQFIQSVNVSFNDKNIFEAMRGTRPAGTSTVTNGNSNGKYQT